MERTSSKRILLETTSYEQDLAQQDLTPSPFPPHPLEPPPPPPPQPLASAPPSQPVELTTDSQPTQQASSSYPLPPPPQYHISQSGSQPVNPRSNLGQYVQPNVSEISTTTIDPLSSHNVQLQHGARGHYLQAPNGSGSSPGMINGQNTVTQSAFAHVPQQQTGVVNGGNQYDQRVQHHQLDVPNLNAALTLNKDSSQTGQTRSSSPSRFKRSAVASFRKTKRSFTRRQGGGGGGSFRRGGRKSDEKDDATSETHDCAHAPRSSPVCRRGLIFPFLPFSWARGTWTGSVLSDSTVHPSDCCHHSFLVVSMHQGKNLRTSESFRPLL